MTHGLCAKMAAVIGLWVAVSNVALSQAPVSTHAPKSALQTRVQAAHKNWRIHDGRQLNAFFLNSGSVPTLAVTVSKNITADETVRNEFAIVTALEFLLADDAYDQVKLIVREHNPRRFSERSIKEHIISRRQFQIAATTVAKVQTTKAAVEKFRYERGTGLDLLFAQLGLK